MAKLTLRHNILITNGIHKRTADAARDCYVAAKKRKITALIELLRAS